MEALKLEVERLEERIAPLFVGGVVLQGAAAVGGNVAVGAGASGTNGTNGTNGTHATH